LFLIETPILFTNLETSELIKYAATAFLAMKISYINQVSDLCDKVGADVHDVARGIGLDGRIGPKFLHPGPGYGGSRLPQDQLALVTKGRAARGQDGARRRCADLADRDHSRLQRYAQAPDGRAHRRRARRIGGGQD